MRDGGLPLISAGAYGYPKAEALQVAVSEIGKFLMDHDLTVYLVVFDKGSFQVSKKLIHDIRDYIDEYYASTHYREDSTVFLSRAADEGWTRFGLASDASASPEAARKPLPQSPNASADFVVDESFSEMLLRKIDERGMTDAQCYKKANIDRKLFNKIKNDPHYKPSKPTAVAFAIALELDLKDTRELLEKAGFALSHSFQFDLIVEYFIRQGNYDIFQINEVLFEFDQVLLGA